MNPKYSAVRRSDPPETTGASAVRRSTSIRTSCLSQSLRICAKTKEATTVGPLKSGTTGVKTLPLNGLPAKYAFYGKLDRKCPRIAGGRGSLGKSGAKLTTLNNRGGHWEWHGASRAHDDPLTASGDRHMRWRETSELINSDTPSRTGNVSKSEREQGRRNGTAENRRRQKNCLRPRDRRSLRIRA